MAKRQVQWAREALQRLRLALGMRCRVCGSTEQLEMDCIVPQGHHHHAAGMTARACFYRKMARQGNLQLLCQPCHTRKSATEL
jgi:5-methylcytosine-specific restriction endonuclease McrA